MSEVSNNLRQLTESALQSAREINDTCSQQAWNGVEVLQDLLQAVTSDPPGLPDLQPLLIHYNTACKCVKLKNRSVTTAGIFSTALQDCTEPSEQGIATPERILATFTFIIQTALALTKAYVPYGPNVSKLS